MQDTKIAAPPAGEARSPEPEFDRRRGPRRAGSDAVGEERRHSDRRKKKPGFAALFGAIFGVSNGHAEEATRP